MDLYFECFFNGVNELIIINNRSLNFMDVKILFNGKKILFNCIGVN